MLLIQRVTDASDQKALIKTRHRFFGSLETRFPDLERAIFRDKPLQFLPGTPAPLGYLFTSPRTSRSSTGNVTRSRAGQIPGACGSELPSAQLPRAPPVRPPPVSRAATATRDVRRHQGRAPGVTPPLRRWLQAWDSPQPARSVSADQAETGAGSEGRVLPTLCAETGELSEDS